MLKKIKNNFGEIEYMYDLYEYILDGTFKFDNEYISFDLLNKHRFIINPWDNYLLNNIPITIVECQFKTYALKYNSFFSSEESDIKILTLKIKII